MVLCTELESTVWTVESKFRFLFFRGKNVVSDDGGGNASGGGCGLLPNSYTPRLLFGNFNIVARQPRPEEKSKYRTLLFRDCF
ncbi:hypothetical protein V1477_006209 [Vespula maculifrons]|uniref:Uncharacterized protein n=1 Tax=Vespula maculifrons TaxID=7453 RepID=A0ABD2CKL0_VESMC